MADFGGQDLEGFRAEVKDWLEANFPKSLANDATAQLAKLQARPESEDALLAWGFFLEILQRTEYIEGYVLAPLAERMLANDSKLKTEFEAKLATDPDFAASPTARKRWFYERSPYYDDRFRLYPVGIER